MPRLSKEELLSIPFDEALKKCPQILLYIEQHGDTEDLKQEFRANWHPEAPTELREVLEEILDPELAAANAAATVAFLQGDRGATLVPGMHEDTEDASLTELTRGNSDSQSDQASLNQKFLEHEESPDQEISIASQTHEQGAQAMETIQAMLAQPFDKVLNIWESLREYITSQDDPEHVEEEFRNHWSPEAPPVMLQVLEELVQPERAAANAAEASEFARNMSGIVEVVPVVQSGLRRGKLRSRL